jgi:hypothetical protein
MFVGITCTVMRTVCGQFTVCSFNVFLDSDSKE